MPTSAAALAAASWVCRARARAAWVTFSNTALATAGFSSKNGVYLANIRKEGDITKLTGGQTLQGTDSYFRGDLVFKKVDGINDNPMADIPFKITNTDTGEKTTLIWK